MLNGSLGATVNVSLSNKYDCVQSVSQRAESESEC